MSCSYFGNNEPTQELFTQQLVESPPSVIAIDVETISLKERLPIGFAIATSPNDSWYFRVLPEPDHEIALLNGLLQNSNITKVFHNSPFDLRIFPLIALLDMSKIADTNVMARLLGYQETKLSVLALDLLNSRILVTADQLLSENHTKTMQGVPYEAVSAMCASHARATLELYNIFEPQVDKEYFATEMKAIPILVAMSLRGLKVNQRDRARVQEKLETEVAYYRSLCAEYDFNPASPMQAGFILAKRGNFLPLTRGKKSYKTDVENLEFCEDPLAAAILNFRKASKLLSTYIKPLAEEDRIFTNYNLDAVVGRISSSDKNLQNIPAPDPNRALLPEGCRFIFEPDNGVYTTLDYSQEHLRILAYFSGDKDMQEVYSQPLYLPDGERNPDADIHILTARKMNITRKLAKTLNYAIPYDASAKTVSVHLKTKDIRRCSGFIDSWFDAYPDAAYWIKCAKEEGLRDGWSLPTLFGRRIRIPEETNAWGKIDKEGMGRKAINYPILGSDGEVMKRALIICEEHNLPLAVTVHDSASCDGDISFPKEQLENLAPVNLPIEIKQTARWE